MRMEREKQALDALLADNSEKQKQGIHFMIASILIWTGVAILQLLPIEVMQRNLFTFGLSAVLVPAAYGVSKALNITFDNKENPLNYLGLLFACNQFLYILIAMWAYRMAPEYFLMIYAMIFGAHLMPYSWLYKSRAYMISSIIVPIASLMIGCTFGALWIAVFMLAHQIVFVGILWKKNVGR